MTTHRKEFEAWHVKVYGWTDFSHVGDGEYVKYTEDVVRNQWVGWQAALASRPAPTEGDAVDEGPCRTWCYCPGYGNSSRCHGTAHGPCRCGCHGVHRDNCAYKIHGPEYRCDCGVEKRASYVD